MTEVNKSVVELAQAELLKVASGRDIAAIKVAVKALDEAERAEVTEARAKAAADWEAKSKARTELTAELMQAIGTVVAPFKSKIVKLVGEDLAILKYSVDYKAELTECAIARVQPKATGKGKGGGKTGKTSQEFGLTLNEIFEKFAKQGDIEDYSKCTGERADSAQYVIKVRVKKAAIAAGLIKPIS